MKKINISLVLFLISLVGFSQKDTLILDENFSNNKNNWTIVNETNRSSTIDSGKEKYTLVVKEANLKALVPIINHTNLNNLNFTIETKLKHISGVENYNYGLRFAEDNSYAMNFYITANGHFRITEYYGSKWHEQIGFTKTAALKPSGKYNILKVTRNAHILQFYINEELVYTCFEKIYFGNKSGYYIPGEKDLKIKVDYLKIWTSPLEIPTVENPLTDVKLENLGEGVNSKWAEKSPTISADGKTLFFIRNEKLEGIEKSKDQVYSSKIKEDGTWETAVKAPFPINIREHTGVISVSSDQNRVSLYSTRDKEGRYFSSKGLCISKKIGDGQWSIPENFEIKDYENTDDYREFCLSSTGQVLILAIRNSESYGARDLYVSFLKNGKWSKPKNLGASINTFAVEKTPFLAADDKTLYFSSRPCWIWSG